MCGIAGFFDSQNTDINNIKKITNQIKHRGPDGFGYFSNNKGLYFGMRRLAIIDLQNGTQPVETENLVLIFNGEIFNFKELQKKYFNKDKGIKSDTKVLANLIELKGFKILDELKGFFSIAIYHKKKQKLFLIRDRFGIKPLYYYLDKKKIYFCSEMYPLKNFFSLGKNNLNVDQVNNFLIMGYVSGENRIYDKIKTLNQGTVLEFDLRSKKHKLIKWHNLKEVSDIYIQNESEMIIKLKEKLINALDYWGRSDVDKVFTLSGGLDSSVLAALYAEQGKKVNTISYGYRGSAKYKMWDETNNIKLITKKIKSNHEQCFWSADEFAKDFFEIINSLEEPYGNSLLPWFLFKKMKKNYKVCITGNGGDELFGNYDRVSKYLNFKGDFYNKKNFTNNYFYKVYYFFNKGLQKKYLTNQSQDVSGEFFNILIKDKSIIDEKRNLSLLDYLTQFRDDMLFAEDKLSMRHSIEVRSPYLDNELFDFVYSLKKQRTSSKEYKHLLRKIGNTLLPKEIFQGPKKGFSMPLSLFMRNNFKLEVKHYLSKENLMITGYINKNFNEDFVKPMLEGDNSNIQLIWNVLVFHVWFEMQ